MKIIASLMSLLTTKVRQFLYRAGFKWRRLRPQIADAYSKPLYRLVALFSVGYLACILLFAGAYWLSDCGFSVGGKPASLSPFDSAYFSVVTITSLGYGEITPVSDGMKAAVMVEVIIGLLLIGLFLTRLSIVHSNEQQERAEALDTRRRDRPQFPAYVEVVQCLSEYIGSYACPWKISVDTSFYTVYTFGTHQAWVRSWPYDDDFFKGFGPNGVGTLNPERSEDWDDHMVKLGVELKALFFESEPPISDEQLLQTHLRIQRLLSTAKIHFPHNYEIRGTVTAEQVIDRRIEILLGVVSDLEAFREEILSRVTRRPENGGTYRNYDYLTQLGPSQLPYGPKRY